MEDSPKSHANRYFIIILLVIPVLVLPLVFAILILLPGKDSGVKKFYTDSEKQNFLEIPEGWTLDYSTVKTNQLPRSNGVGNDLTVSREIRLVSDDNETIVLSQSISSTFMGTATESCYSPSSGEVVVKEPQDVQTTGALRRKIDDTYSYSQLFIGCSEQNEKKYHVTGGGDGIVMPYFVYQGNNPAEADEIFIRNFTGANPVQLFSTINEPSS